MSETAPSADQQRDSDHSGREEPSNGEIVASEPAESAAVDSSEEAGSRNFEATARPPENCVRPTRAIEKQNLEVKESRIPGAGAGLFTLVPFRKGDTVCCYCSSTIIPTREAIRLPDKSYLMRLGPQTYIDLKDEMDVVARYINDCRSAHRYNITFEKRPEEGLALAVALRDIEAGEELYVDYGKWYWAGCGIKPSSLDGN